MTPLDSLSGLILSGGRARRMQDASMLATAPGALPEKHKALPNDGSIDKGLLILDGEPLVARARRFLSPHVVSLSISANRYLAIYSEYGKVIPDDSGLGQDWGPLSGVASGLMQVDTKWLVVIPVDVPFLPSDLIQRLAMGISAHSCLIAYAHCQGPHPLCMLLHQSLASSLRTYLLDGGRAVQQWQKMNEAVSVNFHEGAHDFFNINTPEDLCLAQQLVHRQKS